MPGTALDFTETRPSACYSPMTTVPTLSTWSTGHFPRGLGRCQHLGLSLGFVYMENGLILSFDPR